ncbi:TlpA family protein disulfide reductase [bacterium]|nr:TlpA family protein disulfide reductase [bacterium]
MKKYIVLSMIICSVFVFLTTACARGSKSFMGTTPPEISAGQWINTGPLSLAGLKGKTVVLEFWATWCPPCLQTIPHLREMYNKYKDKGVVIISLTAEKASVVKPFVKQNNMTYPIGIASSTSNAYGVTGIPHALIINASGKVVWEGHPMAGLEEELEKL